MHDDTPIADPFGYGERAVRFVRALTHPKTGRPFRLDRWQERIIRRVYGPRHPDGSRIVRSVVMMVPRGGRKTTLGAALAMLHTIGPERVPKGQAILAAFDRDQARIAFDEASGFVSADARIVAATRVRDHRHQLVHMKSGANLVAVSADAASNNGSTPGFVLFDEIHVWRTRALYDTLRTGLSKTPGTLSVTISQAGRGTETVATEVFSYARRVAMGEVDDPATLPVLFETAKDADWRDEAVWHRANPGLVHGYPDLDALRQFAREAENRPPMREKFKNDHLNVWLDAQADPWIEQSVWDEGHEPVDLDEREGQPAWIGVDLGSTSDLTAVVVAFRDPDEGYSVVPFVFAPEATLRARTDRGDAPYVQWRDEGHLRTTPGDVTDYRAVEALIRELCERFRVEEIAFDPWSARSTMNTLGDEGLPVVEHRQGFVSMAAPMKATERAVLARKLRHGGHPILRWAVGNVVVDTDPAGNTKPNKSKAVDKIDPAVALVMAIGRAEQGDTSASIYADPTARPDGLLFI